MSKIVLFILLLILNFSSGLSASEVNSIDDCSWKNKSETPCLKIIGKISNTSKFTNSAVKKTFITRKDIEQSGAIDLIDVLSTIPNIEISQYLLLK